MTAEQTNANRGSVPPEGTTESFPLKAPLTLKSLPLDSLSEDQIRKLLTDLFGKPMGVRIIIHKEPLALVYAWRHGLDEETLVAKLLEMYGGDTTTWSLHLDTTIQDYLLNCMADRDTRALFQQRLRNETQTEQQVTQYETVLWEQVYAWKPQRAELALQLETVALARLRRILL